MMMWRSILCELCGCTTYIHAGRQAIINRVNELVELLNLSPENTELFEDCERISYDVVTYSFPSSEPDETLAICKWVHSLHEPIFRRRLPKYLDAAKDIFSKLPVQEDVKEAITAYHQLEQLANEITDDDLASIGNEKVRAVVKAVKGVHDSNLAKKTKLRERYALD